MKTEVFAAALALILNLSSSSSQAATNGKPKTDDGPPSEQLERILDPCLDAILAPLEQNPKMPRVEVEKLKSNFAGGQVKAKTPAQQQIYQNAMNVCTALATAMDDRAKAKSEALASAKNPSIMNGSGIIKSSPMPGNTLPSYWYWRQPMPGGSAGKNAEAIRKKQGDERKDADKIGKDQSAFVESGAYKVWTEKSARLHQSVMALYMRQIQLEAFDERNTEAREAAAPPPSRKPVPAAEKPAPAVAEKPAEKGIPAKDSSYAGTWAPPKGTVTVLLRDDHTGVKTKADGENVNGKWTVEEDGDFHVKWEDHMHFKGKLSDDGQTIHSTLGNNGSWIRKP